MRNAREASTFKPIGLAMAAVVAGVAPGVHAPVAEPVHARPHAVDPSNDPRRDEDPGLILGPSGAVEPFSVPARGQVDLFDL